MNRLLVKKYLFAIVIFVFVSIFMSPSFAFAAEIHKAAGSGDLAKVRELLDENPELLNLRDNTRWGEMPIHYAAVSGQIEVVKYLLSRGADINSRDNYNNTPLIMTSNHWHNNLTKYLIEKGADVNAKGDDDETLLLRVTRTTNYSIVEYIVKKGADVNVKDKDGNTPLLNAAEMGDPSTVDVLLKYGADINAVNNRGATVLFRTVELNPFIEVGGWLFREGDVKNYSELILSLRDNRDPAREQIWRLLSKECKKSINEYKSGNPVKEQLKSLILHDFDTILLHKDFYNAEAFKGYKLSERSKIKIKKGIDNLSENALQAFNRSLLESIYPHNIIVSNRGKILSLKKLKILKKLVALGANVNERDEYGWTLLHVAAKGDNVECAKYLLSTGFKPGVKDNNLNQSLHIAADQGKLEMAKLLVEKGADVNAKNRFGITPLHKAIDGNMNILEGADYEVAEFLISKGADVNAKDNNGQSVLDYVPQYREFNREKRELLLKHGAVDNNVKLPDPSKVEVRIYRKID